MRNDFKGINNDTLIRYIELINDKLNANISESISWTTNVASLRNFLNEHDFIEHEGDKISKKKINASCKKLWIFNLQGKIPVHTTTNH